MYIIFGKKDCNHCELSKKLLDLKKMEYRYVDIEKEKITAQELSQLAGITVKSVPAIFEIDNNRFIGGYNQLVKSIGA
jgi:glutaredoxin 1